MDAPEFTVEKLSVPLGAGLWVKRWVVLQDGTIRDWFTNPEQARVFVDTQTQNWVADDS